MWRTEASWKELRPLRKSNWFGQHATWRPACCWKQEEIGQHAALIKWQNWDKNKRTEVTSYFKLHWTACYLKPACFWNTLQNGQHAGSLLTKLKTSMLLEMNYFKPACWLCERCKAWFCATNCGSRLIAKIWTLETWATYIEVISPSTKHLSLYKQLNFIKANQSSLRINTYTP